jgi:predicted HD phosphohydrolase
MREDTMTQLHTGAPTPRAADHRVASFRAMTEGTAEDWKIVGEADGILMAGVADNVLVHLRLLAGERGGFAVDRLTHSLQTATRAERAGRSDEYILAALLHDIGDTLAPANHAEFAASIVKPFVSSEVSWLVRYHAEFQGYYFWHFFGADRHTRERHRGHLNFDLTAEFCAEFDQTSFDPDYPTRPLEHYEPLVRTLMAKPRAGWTSAGD